MEKVKEQFLRGIYIYIYIYMGEREREGGEVLKREREVE
jgi:hypothetical protein